MPFAAPHRRLAAVVAVLALLVSACATSQTGTGVSAATKATTPISAPTSAAVTPKPPTPTPTPTRAKATPSPPASTPPPAVPRGQSLPLDETTGTASQIITVVADSTSSTSGSLQRWSRAPGGGWLPVGAPVTADLGSDGLSTHPSESISATPIGSFTLTRAFGHDANPGTALPYLQTTPADWWISQYGPPYSQLYNTEQRCSGNCPFTQGAPNEHLYYETPAYDYAVVIDYNTPDAGPVVQGAGSAFFLHVSQGVPTAGCVSVPVTDELAILRWLEPSDHPRILIGLV